MLFISIEDFFDKAGQCPRLSRQEEIQYALQMQQGDPAARDALIRGYLPMVAAHVRRASPQMRTLTLAMFCVHALEKAVDSFDFLQDSETFSHRLSWWLRQATTNYIVRN